MQKVELEGDESVDVVCAALFGVWVTCKGVAGSSVSNSDEAMSRGGTPVIDQEEKWNDVAVGGEEGIEHGGRGGC